MSDASHGSWYRRVGVQVVVLALISMALTGSIVFLITDALHTSRRDRLSPVVELGGFFSTLRLLNETQDPILRQGMIEAARKAFPSLGLEWSEVRPQGAVPGRGEPGLDMVAHELGDTVEVLKSSPSVRGEPPAQNVAIGLAGGGYIVAILPGPPKPPSLGLMLTSVLFVAISLLVILPWAAWRIARPLSRFARAAAEFSPEGEHEPLPETGPSEIAAAARSLNRMRSRITDLVSDRTRMLAAVGHDLRTPITRLRLRAEFVEDADLKAAFLLDLDRMSGMVESALAFLKSGRAREDLTMLDLSALAQTIADEYADLGAQLPLDAAEHVMVLGREEELHRAIGNLIDNALKYGQTAEIRLSVGGNEAWLDILDDGPGIPPDQREAMLRPFVRGDSARTLRPDSGMGLGLSIAAAVAEGHGGRVELADRPSGGLLARLVLPLARGGNAGIL